MAIRASFLVSSACATLFAASAWAAPLLQYSWDDCQPLVERRDFATPTVYVQTITVVGLVEPIESFRLVIRMPAAVYPAAWRFEDLALGGPFPPCQPVGRVSLLLAGTSCDSPPGQQTTAHYWFVVTPPKSYLVIDGTVAGASTPDPSRRYTLVRIAFDHSGSVAGEGVPGTCGEADVPLSFEIGEFAVNGVDQRGLVTWEDCLLTWNQATWPTDCPLVVPAKTRTWGTIKTLYR